MADYLTTDTELTSIADAIRTKGGTSDPLTYPAGFVSAIEAIPTGGGSMYSITDTVSGDTVYGDSARTIPISEAEGGAYIYVKGTNNSPRLITGDAGYSASNGGYILERRVYGYDIMMPNQNITIST